VKFLVNYASSHCQLSLCPFLDCQYVALLCVLSNAESDPRCCCPHAWDVWVSHFMRRLLYRARTRDGLNAATLNVELPFLALDGCCDSRAMLVAKDNSTLSAGSYQGGLLAVYNCKAATSSCKPVSTPVHF
jgi:hypothetical protein